MINKIFKSESNYLLFFIHLVLGASCTISHWFLIIYLYLLIFSSISKIFSDFLINSSIKNSFPLVIYFSSFEIFGRMIKAYPYLPWELSKYSISIFCLIVIIAGLIKRLNVYGILAILLLLPSIFIDKSNNVQMSGIIFNLFGPFSAAILFIVCKNLKVSRGYFDSLLNLIWGMTISTLVYTIIETPNYNDLTFNLSADNQTTGGFGSNQVAALFGVGSFLSFYAWMNKLKFSGSHTFDGILIGIFAYQGFLTFSRGGMVVGILSLVLYFYAFKRSKNYRWFVKVKSLRPLLFFGTAIITIFTSYLIIENLSRGNLSLRYQGETHGTLTGSKIKNMNTFSTGRIEIAQSDLKLWKENPYFGVGVGASKFMRPFNASGQASHSEPSRLLSEHGLLGLIIILMVVVLLFKMIRKSKKDINSSVLLALAFIAIASSLHMGMRTFITPVFLAISTLKIIPED